MKCANNRRVLITCVILIDSATIICYNNKSPHIQSTHQCTLLGLYVSKQKIAKSSANWNKTFFFADSLHRFINPFESTVKVKQKK